MQQIKWVFGRRVQPTLSTSPYMPARPQPYLFNCQIQLMFDAVASLAMAGGVWSWSAEKTLCSRNDKQIEAQSEMHGFTARTGTSQELGGWLQKAIRQWQSHESRRQQGQRRG
jgi:hypothetical protein